MLLIFSTRNAKIEQWECYLFQIMFVFSDSDRYVTLKWNSLIFVLQNMFTTTLNFFTYPVGGKIDLIMIFFLFYNTTLYVTITTWQDHTPGLWLIRYFYWFVGSVFHVEHYQSAYKIYILLNRYHVWWSSIAH